MPVNRRMDRETVVYIPNGILLLSIKENKITCRGRALAQDGEWAYPVVSGLLCLLSLYSLIGMNFSDPGILHRGAFEQYPETIYNARVNGRLYHMPWCPTCCFHRPPRTFHCKRCNICVEEFDHHCRWVNNCVGHRNIRLYLLLLMSLCLYLGTVLATCVVFIIHRRNMAFLDKIMTILVAVPAGALLVPLILQLFIKAVAVGTARRPYEEKYDKAFNVGCPRNCYIALCAPLGPKYMSEAVCIQVDQGTNWGPKELLKDLLWPRCTTQAPPRSGKAAPVQKGMPEQGAQLPQTFRVLKGKPTEHPLAVRGVNKYYNASTLKKKNVRFPPTEKDSFPSGTPTLNTNGPETSAIVMEADDGDGEVQPFTAPQHGHTRPGMAEQGAQLPQTSRVLKGRPREHPLAVQGVNKCYNASTLKKKNLSFPPTEKDCFPSGRPALNTKWPEKLAIVMEEEDGDGEEQPSTAPQLGHTRPLNTKGPETSAIVMEEGDGDGDVRPFTAP
ncbi:palmitoyltransferase ZDHHC19-like isoform X1 [Ictidomys tridecemlineatus]